MALEALLKKTGEREIFICDPFDTMKLVDKPL